MFAERSNALCHCSDETSQESTSRMKWDFEEEKKKEVMLKYKDYSLILTSNDVSMTSDLNSSKSAMQGLATLKETVFLCFGNLMASIWQTLGGLELFWVWRKSLGYEVDSIISYAFEQNIITIKNDQLFKVALIDSYHDEVQYTPCTAHSPFLRRWLRMNGKDC